MKIIRRIDQLRSELLAHRNQGDTIGLVPTMGFLHEGHLSLVRKSRMENQVTVVSIFVNPTQFGPNEDFDIYPRDFLKDETLLSKEGTDYVFYPSVEEVYPAGFSTGVRVSGITDRLCGAHRPGHFDGVALVVTKLLNIVQPDAAYFGLKDYQQYAVIKRLVADLNIPCRVQGEPIVRESDGLAMSSRNVFLSKEERLSALSLYRSFSLVKEHIESGIHDPAALSADIWKYIESHPFAKPEYVELVNPDTLEPALTLKLPFVCMLAVRIGNTRLIDNQLINFCG